MTAAGVAVSGNLIPMDLSAGERHTDTDEVFVLLKWCGILIIGGNDSQVEGIYPQSM